MPYATYKTLGQKDEPQQPALPCLEVKTQQKKDNLLRSFRVCVVDIYGDWCGPCKTFAPKFAALANRYFAEGKCILFKENVDNHLSQGITGVPTIIFYKDGEEVHRESGMPEREIIATIESLIKDV